MQSAHVPSVGEIDAIGACPQPVLRNLRITHAYHELSLAVGDAVGPGANWCTFATWASKLRHPPFSPDQLRAMAAGRTPDGDL